MINGQINCPFIINKPKLLDKTKGESYTVTAIDKED